LIRRERRGDVAFYELVTEGLIPWLREKQTSRRLQAQRKKWALAVAGVAGTAIVAWIGAAGVVSYRTSAVLEKENLSRLVNEVRAAKERESELTEQLRNAEETIQKLRPAPEVHLSPGANLIRRDSSDSRAYPLNEPGRPSETAKTDPVHRVRLLHNIIQWLDVAHNARYRRTPVEGQPSVYTVFSNIYAYDYAYLAGVYLPRVWWTAPALEAIQRGSVPDVKYGTTVREMDQNAICDWLSRSGVLYGWRAARNLTVLQAAANEGKVALICAANVDSRWAGDIALIVPENADLKAVRQGTEVTRPLQSKAGIENVKYGTPEDAWWTSREYRSFGFWYNEP
jgi:hypothetical protein